MIELENRLSLVGESRLSDREAEQVLVPPRPKPSIN